MTEWHERNTGLLAKFVASHSQYVANAELILRDAEIKNRSYILIHLKRELSETQLADLGADFEDVFPDINYATENTAPDPFWNS